jgi:hypothetical protein
MTRHAIPPPMQAAPAISKTAERFVMTFALQLKNAGERVLELVAEIFYYHNTPMVG